MSGTIINGEGSYLQNEGLTVLLISFPADSTTICHHKCNHLGRKAQEPVATNY